MPRFIVPCELASICLPLKTLLTLELKAAPENMEVTGYVKSRTFLNTDVIPFKERKKGQMTAVLHKMSLAEFIPQIKAEFWFIVFVVAVQKCFVYMLFNDKNFKKGDQFIPYHFNSANCPVLTLLRTNVLLQQWLFLFDTATQPAASEEKRFRTKDRTTGGRGGGSRGTHCGRTNHTPCSACRLRRCLKSAVKDVHRVKDPKMTSYYN